MSRLLRELDRADISRKPSAGSRLRRTVGRREGMVALLITGAVIGAVVVIGPVWEDEVAPLYTDDPRTISADGLSAVVERPGGALPPGVSPVRVLPPVLATTTGRHEFLQVSGGVPVAYDPCLPIHYVINPAGVPAQGEDLIREAMSEITEATGLAFLFDGITEERPDENRSPITGSGSSAAWAPVLIAWSDEAEYRDLAGEIAGYAGSASMGTDDSETARYVSGAVVLDRKDFADILEEDDGRSIAKAIVLHEFGHLVGLGHVEDTGELMFETTSEVTRFGPGDRQGLAILGAGRCFP